MSSRDTIAELLRAGFRGTRAEIVAHTGINLATVYKSLQHLERLRLADVVDTKPGRGGEADVWAATPSLLVGMSAGTGVVASALANQHPIARWVAEVRR